MIGGSLALDGPLVDVANRPVGNRRGLTDPGADLFQDPDYRPAPPTPQEALAVLRRSISDTEGQEHGEQRHNSGRQVPRKNADDKQNYPGDVADSELHSKHASENHEPDRAHSKQKSSHTRISALSQKELIARIR